MTATPLLELAQELSRRGEPYAMVTVVRVTPPTSAYVGAQAIVRGDGTLEGWIGGGCAKDVVIAAAREAIAADQPRLIRIGNDAGAAEAGVELHPMACASNGAIELFIQPQSATCTLCVLGATPAADEARFLAARLGIRLADSPDEVRVVLVATQGAGDEDALERALLGKASHVLLIASRRKAGRLRDVLRMRGVGDAALARLQAPAGPDVGAKTPVEIAMVAMTGVLAALRGRVGASLPSPGDGVAHAEHVLPAAEIPGATFVNPVCGIEVSVTNPKHVERYEDVSYYFCCDGCWSTFRENPAKYAAIHRASLGRVPA